MAVHFTVGLRMVREIGAGGGGGAAGIGGLRKVDFKQMSSECFIKDKPLIMLVTG